MRVANLFKASIFFVALLFSLAGVAGTQITERVHTRGLAQAVEHIKVGDRGLVVREGKYADGLLTSRGERYISMNTADSVSDLLYCYINQPAELEVVRVIKSDVVVRISNVDGTRCSVVLMQKKHFAKHKKAYLAEVRRLEQDQARRTADLARLKFAQKVWPRLN